LDKQEKSIMRTRLLCLVLGLLVLGIPLRADWLPIPPEVWALKQDPGPNARGAIILDEWVRYGAKATEVKMRVRIFDEEGKGAAAMPAFKDATLLEGRTVQRDGSETPFLGLKDLVKQTLKIGNWEIQQQFLIPPGLTADCVVDLHYSIDGTLPLPWGKIPIQGAYPVRNKVLEMATELGLGFVLINHGGLYYQKTFEEGYTVYTFSNLPGEPSESFSLPALSACRFLIYFQPWFGKLSITSEPGEYWKNVVNDFYNPFLTRDVKAGRTYRDWSKALRAGLEGDPPARAAAILASLERDIQNGSHLTQAESASLARKEAEEVLAAKNLDASVKRKRTSVLPIPDVWPKQRTFPIVLPYCQQFRAVSHLRVPAGWMLVKDADLDQSNTFGRVSGRVEAPTKNGETLVTVTYTVDVETMFADPALRQFLAWTETASRRILHLERP
jgi:hypothetical protein